MNVKLTKKQFCHVIEDFCLNAENRDLVYMAQFFIKELPPSEMGNITLFCVKQFENYYEFDVNNPELLKIKKIINKLK